MTDRYATPLEREIGMPWCRVCGRLLDGGFVCDGPCLPPTN